MNLAEFQALLDALLDEAGIDLLEVRAHIAAKAVVESLDTTTGRVTDLALAHNNLFGINWVPDDGDRYHRVILAGNKVDKELGRASVSYRVYRSKTACVENVLYQLYASDHRRAAWKACGYWLLSAHTRPSAARTFVAQAEATWAADPEHVRTMLAEYDRQLARMKKSAAPATDNRAVIS